MLLEDSMPLRVEEGRSQANNPLQHHFALRHRLGYFLPTVTYGLLALVHNPDQPSGLPISDRTRSSRKLAAIFAADISGYSALIGADEEGTVRKLKVIREAILPIIESFGGRIIDLAGDGVLSEFGSAVRAVEAAIAVQDQMVALNKRSEPAMHFRIGINLGDVISDGERLYGDGINIAARLEALADPGGICISAKVFDEINGKLPASFRDLGELHLKNIVSPIRVFSYEKGRARDNNRKQPSAAAILTLPDKPSIAILPFSNMSGDSDQEYFADGMVEDITTALSRFRQIFVIARNSSFAFKGKGVDTKQVGTDLGVRYVLKGGVRKSGNKVRITSQLIDAQSEIQVWADRYDRELIDIFALQDEIASSVAGVLEPALLQAEQKRALRKPPASLDAWEAYQRGMWHFNKYAPQENFEAQTYFRRAIQIDAGFAPGYYGVALAQHLDCWLYAVRQWEELAGAPLREAQMAVSLDPADPWGHAVLGALKLAVGDWDAAVAEGQIASSLNPNSGWSLFSLGNALGWSGAHMEGVANLKKAIRMSPRDPMAWLWQFWIGIFLYFAGHYEAALEAMREVSRVRSGLANRWIAACLGQLDRTSEARDALREAISISLPLFEKFTRDRPPWMRPEDHEHMLTGLCKAGWGLATPGVELASPLRVREPREA